VDKSKIDRSMYQKAKVEASEKEHIAAPASTMLADAWIRLKKNKAAVVALFILIGIILLAIFAPIFSKYSFRDTDYNNVYGLPSAAHIFGADQFGRDLWVRTWMGTRISLMIALVAAILDLVVGVLYGAVSALFGGKVDAIMQRIIEVLVGIPSLIIVILFLMAFPAGVGTIIAALSITGWVNMARLVRAEILKLKKHNVIANDLLTAETAPIYDAVVMNPPFSEECEHIKRAFDFVCPGGSLVAVCSSRIQWKSTRKYAQFRDWLSEHTHSIDECGAKFEMTDVHTVVLVMDKAAA